MKFSGKRAASSRKRPMGSSGKRSARPLFNGARLSAPLLICTIASTLFAGCNRRDLTYYMESEITLEVDWSQAALSATEQQYGATAVFFPQDGRDPKTVLMGDRTHQKVRLPAGIYDVAVFNRSFDDFGAVTFSGGSFDDFHAEARQVNTKVDPENRATTRVIVQTPEEVAADTRAGFEVTEAMLGNYSEEIQARMQARSKVGTRAEETVPESYVIHLTPHKLTRKVLVTLHVKGLNNVRAADGTVDGVFESVRLRNGALPAGTVTQQFKLTDITFEGGSPFDGIMTGTFNVFGMERPDNRTLNLTFYLTDGKTVVSKYFETKIVPNEFPDGTTEYLIELTPPKISDVKPTGGENAGFDVDVEGWGTPRNVEIPMDDG